MKINDKDRIVLSKVETYWRDEKCDTGICFTYDSGKFTIVNAKDKDERESIMRAIDDYFKWQEEGD